MTLEEISRVLDEAKNKKSNAPKRKRGRPLKVVKETEEVSISPPLEEDEDKIQEKTDRFFEENSDEIKSELFDTWKPFQIEFNILPEFKPLERKSNNFGTSKIDRMSRILTFVENTQRKRYKEGCTVIPIPQTSKQNLMIWGYSMKISRAIEDMIEMGLITVYNDKYRFGVPYEGGNYGKLYSYYVDNERKFIKYCKENGIHKFVVKNVEEIESEEQIEKIDFMDEVKVFEISDVHFGHTSNLEKPKGFSKTDFEMFLTQCLYSNYPNFKFHQAKVDEINERFYESYPEFKLRFRPHFTWKGNNVVKIGIRLTNEYCSKKRDERKELLLQYGFHLEKDVKSSVPRLTLSINEGHWIDEDIDIYELINNEFEPGSEFTYERRENIKKYVLKAYFDKGTDKMLGKNVTFRLGKLGIDKKIIDETMGRLRRALIKAVGGKTFGSDIFYIESCVYLMTLYDLLCSGHMVWLVYDAFYSNGTEDEETYKYMVAQSIKMNFRYFMETSEFRKYSKDSDDLGAVNEKTLTVEEVYEKYKMKLSE